MNSSTFPIVMSAVLVLAGITAIPAQVQDSAKPKARAVKKAEEKPVTQQKAEKITIPQLEFKEADLDECISYLRKKSEECDTEPKANQRGLNFLNRVPAGKSKPITLSLKNVSVWDAAQKIAAAAGQEASLGGVGGNAIVIHAKGAGPTVQPAGADYTKSAVWQRAEKIVIDRAAFAESSATDVCAFLNKKSKAADKSGKGVDISAADGLERTVTMDLRNVHLTDGITAVAEVLGAEITASDEKIILKPAKKQP